jgi:hypothetical protein
MTVQWWPAAALAGAMALTTGCEAAPDAAHNPAPPQPSAASPAVNPPATSASATPPALTADLGQPAPARDGKVTVAIRAETYRRGAPITVIVTNGLSRTIFTDDSKTDCSIVILQRQDRSPWSDIPGCAQRRPPATVATGPAHLRTLTVHPASSNLRITPDAEPALPAGTYRAKYTYRYTAAPDNGDPYVSFSRPFTIN